MSGYLSSWRNSLLGYYEVFVWRSSAAGAYFAVIPHTDGLHLREHQVEHFQLESDLTVTVNVSPGYLEYAGVTIDAFAAAFAEAYAVNKQAPVTQLMTYSKSQGVGYHRVLRIDQTRRVAEYLLWRYVDQQPVAVAWDEQRLFEVPCSREQIYEFGLEPGTNRLHPPVAPSLTIAHCFPGDRATIVTDWLLRVGTTIQHWKEGVPDETTAER